MREDPVIPMTLPPGFLDPLLYSDHKCPPWQMWGQWSEDGGGVPFMCYIISPSQVPQGPSLTPSTCCRNCSLLEAGSRKPTHFFTESSHL